MKALTIHLLLFLVLSSVISGRKPFLFKIDWICDVKTSCIECLKIVNCTWCEAEKKCFSKNDVNPEGFCNYNAKDVKDYGFSIEDNAGCACEGDIMEKHCVHPEAPEGLECSGRGVCQCGRCICDPTPDPQNPSKVIIGEFCEFDNFSCDGPRCNEGPYSIHEIQTGYGSDIDEE